MVSGKSGRPKRQKPCGRLRGAERDDVAISASGDPGMAFKSEMASILPMVRAFYPLSPSRRIAAGHAARNFQNPRANKRATCARELNNSATNVVLFEQSLVTRLVLPLDVIEQRTA